MYYKHSGRFTPVGLVTAGLAGCIAATILAYAYGRGIILIPEVKLAAIAAIAFGCLVGAATGYGLIWGRVRNNLLGSLLSGCVSALALYISWAVWVASTLESHHVAKDVSWIALAQHPVALWNLVCDINQYGTWSFSDGPTTAGGILWIIWFLEAVCVIGGGAFVGSAVMQAHAFCESCGTWCKSGAKFILAVPQNVAQLKMQLEANDLHSVETLGPSAKGTDHLDVELDSCPQCRQFHTMSVVHTMIRRSKSGKPTVRNHTIVKHLLLGPGHAETLRHISEKVSQAVKMAPPKANAAAAGRE